MKPLVSIIIPSIPERKKYIERAIQSVKAQTYKNTEIISIIDKSITANQARNLGIKKAKGDYIAFLDDDDIWLSTKIEKQIKAMNKNPNAVLVSSFSIDLRYGYFIDRPPLEATKEDIKRSLRYSSTSTYLAKKDILEKIGGFDESLPSAQEYELALRLLDHGIAICIPEILVVQNKTDSQISKDMNKRIKGIKMVYKKHKLNPIRVHSLIALYRLSKIFGMKPILFVKKFGGK